MSLDNLLVKYDEIFSRCDQEVGLIENATHNIELEKDCIISLPNRRIPMAYIEKVDEAINDLLKSNVIRKSKSPFNSPLVVVPKKDNSVRLCVDYRRLNEMTVKESFYFPDSSELFDRLGGNSIFSTLDMQKGYYQVRMAQNAIEKTAFSCPQGHFEFLRMPFGLCGAPCTFQKTIQRVLSEENNKICLIYLDDIIIYGKTMQEHNERLETVLKKLSSAGIKLSRNKCIFGKSSVKFLGHVIDSKGISTDPSKTEKIQNWKRPDSMKDLATFIGFASYYRRFIRHFSLLAAPLENVLTREKSKRNLKIQWSENMVKSFEQLKGALCSTPVLVSPKNNSMFILDTDASQFGIGAVLSQRDPDQNEQVVSYASNRLSKTESRYCATRKELLAVVHYIRKFSHFLTGRKFILRTDHKSLTWLMSWRNPSTSQYFAWISELSQYDFVIEHRKGEQHINADVMSRLQHDDNCKQCEVNYVTSIDDRSTTEHKIEKLLNLSANEAQQLGRNPAIEIINEEIYFYDPNGSKRKVISRKDGCILAEKVHRNLNHIGQKKLNCLLKQHVFWINQASDCNELCSSCVICLKRKSLKSLRHNKSSIDAEKPFEKICIDIAGPLPDHQGKKYLLGIVDSFSKFVALVPLRSLHSEEITSALFEKWISIFGPPKILHSDQGPNLNSRTVKELCDYFNITKTKTAPYHPQSNGICERLFRTVKNMMFCGWMQNSSNWPEQVPMIEMALRGTYSSSIGCSPFEIIFGYPMCFGSIDKCLNKDNKWAIQYDKVIKRIFATDSEKCRTIVPPLKIDEYVMIRILPPVKGIYKPRFDGPFKIVKTASNGKFIVVNGRNNERIERNICDVKRAKEPQAKCLSYEVTPQEMGENSHEHNQNCNLSQDSQPCPRYPTRLHQFPNRYGFTS